MKQNELETVKKEIREYEKRLAETKKNEKNTLERLDLYERQTALIRRVIGDLHARIEENRRGIDEARAMLESEQQRLERVKERYARSIVTAYKRGRLHDTELLLSSTSLNQMFIRSRYLRAFGERQRKEAAEIRLRQEAVSRQKAVLEQRLAEQSRTVAEKHEQESILQKKQVEQQVVLERLRKEKEAYQAELRRKQAAAAQIERLIADLIERERLRRVSSAAKPAKGNVPRNRTVETSPLSERTLAETVFGRLRGRLPWPVAGGRLIGGFGEQVNPKHGTVTISNGIDIGSEANASVRAVADGVVSTVFFIPGYGNLVILDHGEGFRTVYAQLSSILVRQGERIKAGQTIARSGEALSGPCVHFEIWRQRNKQNPLHWLSRN
ncbi:MAG: peptidoglycan DD-metalloendopeptidase family protein [Bacteroidota bacterium]|nr:peptidoglycan DD-metalloendopeptidase family protein [Bacteroidota bacterium]